MTKAGPKLKRLEDSILWKEACDLAEYIYSQLHLFPAEETWVTASKLRNSANDLMFFVAQGLGNSSPSTTEYDWSNARKTAGTLKTMYRFACRQKFIELEPEVMVRLSKLAELIDAEVTAAYEQTDATYKKEVEAWHRKYEKPKGKQA